VSHTVAHTRSLVFLLKPPSSAAQAPSKTGPNSVRRENSGAQLSVDEQENFEPKTADSSIGSSGNGSPVRMRKTPPVKPASVTAKSKLVVPDGARRAAGTRGMIVPPGVVAANPDPKGKGRMRKPGPRFGVPPRAAVGSKLPIAKTISLESVETDRREQDADTAMGEHQTSSHKSPPLFFPSSCSQCFPISHRPYGMLHTPSLPPSQA